MGYITGEIQHPALGDSTYANWELNNSIVMAWLINSMESHISRTYLFLRTAKAIWDAVNKNYFDLENASQGDLEGNLKFKRHLEKERLYEFLTGLNRELDEVRGRIFGLRPLPSIDEAFAEVRREASRRRVMLGGRKEAVTSGEMPMEAVALATKNTSSIDKSSGDHRNNQRGGRPWCSHCNKPGHSRDTCWDIHGDDRGELDTLKLYLASEFELNDLGALRYFLGMEVGRSKSGITVSQRKYVLDLLRDTGMLGCRPVETPMEPNVKLGIEGGKDNREQYQRLVGKLIYLSHTLPDIAFAVSVISQFMHSPKKKHLDAVYGVLRRGGGFPVLLVLVGCVAGGNQDWGLDVVVECFYGCWEKAIGYSSATYPDDIQMLNVLWLLRSAFPCSHCDFNLYSYCTVNGALRCLALLSSDLDDTVVPTIVPIIFPSLHAIVSSPQIYDKSLRTRALSIVYSCTSMLGVMSGAYKFSAILQHPVQSEDPDDWTIRMEVLKCLNQFVQNFPSLVESQIVVILGPLWQTFLSSLGVYERSSIEGIEDPYDGRYDSDGAEKSLESFVIQLFEFLLTIVGSRRFVKVFGNNISELVYYTIAFLQITEQQVHTWSLDANQYIADEDDNTYSCRVSGALLLEEVVSSCGMEGIHAIMDAVKKRHSESQKAKAAGSAGWWRDSEKVYAGLSLANLCACYLAAGC
ncbi:hypothetical protein RJ639_036938, partial [Escallonia herrerae]